jgi:type II secretory pathway component PulJ
MKNENGLTLIEVLSILVLISIISIISFSIISTSYANHQTQKEQIDELYKNTYVLKIISNDFRETIELVETSGNFIFKKYNSSTVTYTFDSPNNILYRNGIVIAEDLNRFSISMLDSTSFELTISNRKNEELKTTLYLRSN